MTVLASLGEWVRSTGCAPDLVPGGSPEADDPPRPALVVLVGDHGVANGHEISSLATGAGRQVAEEITSGGSVLNDLAAVSGADVSAIDTNGAIGTDGTAGTAPQSPLPSTDRQDGLSEQDVLTFLDQGRALADGHADSATPLLLVGTMGAGATTTAAAVIGTVCNIEPVKLLHPDDPHWPTKTTVIRDAMFRARRYRRGPATASTTREILRILGTPDLAVAAGLLSQAAERRTPVILDGVSTLAAALLAESLHPGSTSWWLAPHTPDEPSAAPALRRLSLTPVHEDDLGLPDGGAGGAGLAVLPMIRTAAVVSSH
jgi:nicotinate-nucleotide--dimethylbenzimidazole phosphoribosyltransferase